MRLIHTFYNINIFTTRYCHLSKHFLLFYVLSNVFSVIRASFTIVYQPIALQVSILLKKASNKFYWKFRALQICLLLFFMYHPPLTIYLAITILTKVWRAVTTILNTAHKKVLNKSGRKFYYLQKWSPLFSSYDARFTRYLIKRVFQDGGSAAPPTRSQTWQDTQGTPPNICQK